MAPSKKPKTESIPLEHEHHFPKPETLVSEYEQQREENIRRNREMISSLRLHQKSSELSDLRRPTKKPPRTRNVTSKTRQSLRFLGLPPPKIENSLLAPPFPVPTSPFSFSDVYTSSHSYQPLVKAVRSAQERGERECTTDLDLRVGLELKEENVRKIVGEKCRVLCFLPVSDRDIILTGNMYGNLGFWNADLERGNEDANDMFVFFPHRSSVSSISVHPSNVRKVYSSCYDGDLCLMDIEKEMFNMLYSSECTIFSLCQSPNNHNLLYLGQDGPVRSFDERTDKICNTWELHNGRINTIDFNPTNSNIFVTSSTDGFAQIWDLRKIDKIKPKSIKEIQHTKGVRSAYFSPTGIRLVSTCIDKTIRVSSGSNYDNFSIINYNAKTFSFRAIWGWSDSYILIGNAGRAIDVILTNDNIITPIQNEFMTTAPCRFVAINACKEGHLACASEYKLYLWTKI